MPIANCKSVVVRKGRGIPGAFSRHTWENRFQSELGLVDFRQPEITRNTINDWVKGKTNQKIKELFKPGSINPQFRMALTDAIYFKGNWA